MPLFEYQCQSCSHRFELLVRAGQPLSCPRCQGDALEKLFSVFSVNAPAERAAAGFDTPCGGACSEPGGPSACPMAGPR